MIMKKYLISLGVLIFPVIIQFAFSLPQEEDATAIVKKADEKFRGESQKADMSMKIIRPSWERELRMKTWSLGKDYSLTLITEPAKEKGRAFLKRENEIWNWSPNIERLVKLPPSMMMQSWMGSDFKNNDLIRESSIVTDYNHELMGNETIEGEICYKIKMLPKADAPVVWSKVITWVTKDDYLQVRTEFYGDNQELVDVMKFSEIRTLDGRKIPSKLTMIPQDKEGHKTIIKYHDANFNIEIEPSFFSKQNMRKLSR